MSSPQWKGRLLIYDSKGGLILESDDTREIALPPGIYRATYIVGNEDILLLTTTHSLLVGERGRMQPNWREVTDFPEQWTPVSEELVEYATYATYPPGEYCMTNQGMYRRKVDQGE